MIESNIKKIIKTQKISRTKTVQGLKLLSRRQTSHEKANNKQFQAITTAIALLPTQDVITKTIQDTIKVVVNGKIDGIKADVADVKSHLSEQDTAMKDMSNKIKPVIGGLAWVDDLIKVVGYCGGLAISVGGIIELLKLFHILK